VAKPLVQAGEQSWTFAEAPSWPRDDLPTTAAGIRRSDRVA
jgi:hypothetical protein